MEKINQPVIVSEGNSIGIAVQHLKQDSTNRVYRKGWNGKNLYLELQTPDKNSKMTLPYIYIVTTNVVTEAENPARGCVPWLASQTDFFAEDWVLVSLI